MRRETILNEARFDAMLPKYWMASTVLALSLTVIGIPIAIAWLFFGWRVHRLQYERLECHLTDRSLNIRKGFLFRVEKTIPLDKIQDVGLREGPLLRWLGLSSLVVETAGQSSPQGGADAHLVGVIDAPAFRDLVLDQRDAVVERLRGGGPASPAPALDAAGTDAAGAGDATALLREIRDSLKRIEGRLQRES